MARTRSSRPWVALGIAVLAIAAGCTTTGAAGPSTGGGSAPGTSAAVTFTGHSPREISRPATEGKGVVLPQPAAPLPDGYVLEEFFIGGTATRFDPVATPDDGFWTAKPAEEAAYRTRVIVRRPAAEHFSGTVLLEWFNVSAIEAAPDWSYISEEVGREGHAYIGVSTQAQGIVGGETLLDVDVDAGAAADAGVDTDTSGLKNIDPERYGSLVHPGDAYAFDIFSQVGRAATESPGDLLGGLKPERVLGIGESQSAIFLSTLVNAVHPLDPVFDGFLIHSRGATVTPVDGKFVRAAEGQDASTALERGVRIRTDLEVPVLVFETETDLTLLGYANARQPDTDLVRTWEVAGTAHSDAHVIRAVVGGPRSPSVGSLLGCTEPINAGPHHEGVQAALHHLVGWSAGGAPPPRAEPIGVIEGDEVVISRDEHQIAIGGVRNPLVDVPVVAYTGDPPNGASIEDLAGGEGDLCILFGRTITFDKATLLSLHGTADRYLEAFRASADKAVAAGFLLRGDADQLITEAEGNAALFQ
jgi:hypothetical protein